MNCSPFKLWVIVGSAAPMEVYKSVDFNVPFGRFAMRRGGNEKKRLTSSMAVRRMDSAREKMMHQNIQSFDTPLERLSERLAEDGEGSMAELVILVRQWDKICRREKQDKG
jgi:hypothetical protein